MSTPVTTAESPTLDGAALIAAERRHQIEDRGFTPEYDNEHSAPFLLVAAAVHFAEAAEGRRDPRAPFPLMDESLSCKPRGVKDPIHDLVKAGALIAAEIDRLRAIGTPTHGNEGVWT